MRITIGSFGGIVPRQSDHNLSVVNARKAHDVKLRNGRIEAWNEPCEFWSAIPGARSFHLHGCYPVSWREQVQAAEVSPDWRCFYISGRTDTIESVYLDQSCAPVYYKLGLPAPETAPRVTGTEACGRDVDVRSYVYTYVNQWGEESAPSPVSAVIRCADGAPVTVTNIALPPDGYGIVAAKVYRSASAPRNADGKEQKPSTDFFFVGVVLFPSTSFLDKILIKGLGFPLETHKNRMPPAGIRNVVNVEGTVRLAGTTANRVHLSEFYQPHNWPAKYDLTLDSNIVHMGCVDQKLYVTTDTVPYVIDVSSCEDMKCIPVMDIQMPMPDISCKYNHAAIVTPHGYIYSSPLGVILVDPSAKWHIVTAKWFSADDWKKVRPDTARFAYWEGFLFVITEEVSFMLNINGDPYGDMKMSELVTISDSPIDLAVSNTGSLIMLSDAKLLTWNGSNTPRPYFWESRELTGGSNQPNGTTPSVAPPVGYLWTPVSAKIRTRETDFTLLDDADHVVYTRRVASERPFRLPRYGRHSYYFARFQGVEPVEFFDMGTSHFTVNYGE